MATELLKTPLFSWHQAAGARLVPFAGWSMPVQYTSIVEEHRATRGAVGLFDISHMGRLRFEGADAAALLDRLLTRPVLGLKAGRIRYSLMTDEQGGILDDVLVYHLRDAEGAPFHMLVVNAGNREKIVSWIRAQASDARLPWSDETEATAMIAVQGPRAIEITEACLPAGQLSELKYYRGIVTTVLGHTAVVSRTGYTGEDGCELIVPAAAATTVWEHLAEALDAVDGRPAGLGARDTLRLEAAMPLYGHELSEDTNPFQADLAFAVGLQDHEFVGREALLQCQAQPGPRRVGLELRGPRIARQHHTVGRGDEAVGEVTSGTFSPTLERPIAMAYVRPEVAAPQTELWVDVRGHREPARVVELPFYRRSE